MVKLTIDVQRQVIAFGLEDFCPNAMLPNLYGGQYGATPSQWRDSVIALACGTLTARLISPIAGIEKYEQKSAGEIKRLLQEGDLENEFDVDMVWDVLHFFGTEKLLTLLAQFGLHEWSDMEAVLSLPLGKALAELKVVELDGHFSGSWN